MLELHALPKQAASEPPCHATTSSHICYHGACLQVQKPFTTAAQCLSSKGNGIAAPRLLTRQVAQRAPAAAAALEIVCADGPRGMKLKTRKAAKKRYKITATGKVMVRRAGKQHLNEKKSKSKKKTLG